MSCYVRLLSSLIDSELAIAVLVYRKSVEVTLQDIHTFISLLLPRSGGMICHTPTVTTLPLANQLHIHHSSMAANRDMQ